MAVFLVIKLHTIVIYLFVKVESVSLLVFGGITAKRDRERDSQKRRKEKETKGKRREKKNGDQF
jgi:hypothetical protein